MRIGSLFSGYGGLDMGVQHVLGGAVVWHAEVDRGACAVLDRRHPGVPQLGDVTTVDWSTVEPVDVLTGGFPCQDVSVAGKRAGLKAGTRSGLWATMCDAVAELRPPLVVIENVRGLLTAEGEPLTDEILRLEADRDHLARSLALVGRKRRRAIRERNTTYAAYHQRDTVRLTQRLHRAVGAVRHARARLVRAIGAVLRDLADIGYDAAWCGLRAADVGAVHGRYRIFVLAWPSNTDDERRARDGAARAGRDGPADGGRGRARDVSLLPTPAATAAPRSGPGYGPTLAEALLMLPTPRATDGTHGGPGQRGSSGDLTLPSAVALAERFGRYAEAVARWVSVTGAPAPDATEPTGRGGRHRLAPAFVEWMMGLPPGHVTDLYSEGALSYGSALRMLGNGVVPQQAAAALVHLLGVRGAA